MAANEKQLEKVTLTLTNKMAGSWGAPGWSARPPRDKSFNEMTGNINLVFTPNIAGEHAHTRAHTPTCSAADLTRSQSHPASLVSMATDFNLINWVEN